MDIKNDQNQGIKAEPQVKSGSDTKKSLADILKAVISEKILKKGKETGNEEKPATGREKIAPEGQQNEALYSVKDLTKDLTPKKIIKLASLLILGILIILAVYVKFIRKTPVKEVPYLINAPTPSFYPYQKYKPSIYAEDANFKKIDEGISVLENEVKSVALEEKTLLPPSLDFDVVFK